MAYFEKTYGPPWEGVDSSQDVSLISDHALAYSTNQKSNNFLFKNGQLWNAFNVSTPTGNYPNEPSSSVAVGLYTSYQATPASSTLTGNAFGVLGRNGDTRLFRLTNATPPAWTSFGAGSFPATTAIFQFPSNFLVLQGFLYLPIDGGAILKVDASAGTITTLTSFTSCRYIGELGGHLLGAYTIEGVIPSTNFPYRIRWSGNYNFGQWNSAVDATAGFQDLSDVEDQITGLFTFGTTGYILRQNGITQINVTSSGTAPFQFDHLWKSNFGLGCVFPFSAAQYGPLGIFIGKDDIYMLSSSGYQGIGGKAKNAIFDSLYGIAGNTHIIGAIIPHLGASGSFLATPALGYLLCFPFVNQNNHVFWFYNFADKLWSHSSTNVAAVTSIPSQFFDSHSDTALADPDFGPAYYGDAQTLGLRGQGLIALGFQNGTQGAISLDGGSSISSNFYFKLEAPRPGRKFTIHKIIVDLFSSSSPTFNLTFNVVGSTHGSFSVTKTPIWESALFGFGSCIMDKILTGQKMNLKLTFTCSSSVAIQRVTIIGNDGDGDQL